MFWKNKYLWLVGVLSMPFHHQHNPEAAYLLPCCFWLPNFITFHTNLFNSFLLFFFLLKKNGKKIIFTIREPLGSQERTILSCLFLAVFRLFFFFLLFYISIIAQHTALYGSGIDFCLIYYEIFLLFWFVVMKNVILLVAVGDVHWWES